MFRQHPRSTPTDTPLSYPALFLSDRPVSFHFDHYHISGIPHLLSTFDVKRILIPLVPLWARLLVASQLGLSITQEEQSLIRDPVGTLSALPEGNAPDE